MDTTSRLTLQDLQQRRLRALIQTEKAAQAHPLTYRRLKRMLDEINTRPLDVAAYYATALDLAGTLNALRGGFGQTLFDYYYHNVDPEQSGDVRYFRGVCLDLAEQIAYVDQWRAKRHHLTRIK